MLLPIAGQGFGFGFAGHDVLLCWGTGESIDWVLRELIGVDSWALTLQQSSTDALDVAQTALSVSGEAEALLHFLGAAYPLNSRADLGKSMLDMFECYGLRVVLRIESEEGDLYLSHEGDVGPLEQEALEMGPDDGRFIDFGRRTLAKYGGVSVLIRNMPVEDVNRHARWKKTWK
ncbi:MAG: hypothetical protein DIZ79_12090 [endosymbiont of Lamellibrachia luymesi]|uniref:Uncharacterized protein n=1 Tax=endosymbiont of Lamellibrachia luymesi TaxID=2200907 RepID=A0A370DWC8_9GAMM|nr:MAG: hypothetical protein DIZ79_12090 [endosymbiont of Lamellibrachia luymesi]